MSDLMSFIFAVSSVSEDKAISRKFTRPVYLWIGAGVLIVIALVRIISTYTVFSQTYDEPAQIGKGMEWLDKGEYTVYIEHPPLARVMVAIGPYLAGTRSTGNPGQYGEGNAILHTGGAYFRNLALARSGILPFFILASVVVWMWAKRDFGLQVAFLSTAFFTTLPSILAHSGVATTDMPVTATFILALFALRLWLEQPDFRRSLFLSVAVAMSILSKFSALVFLPVAGGCIALVHWYKTPKSTGFLGYPVERWLRAIAAATLVSFIVIWGTYRFSIGKVDTLPGFLSEIQIPAREFTLGIQSVMEHNREGHLAYLLGEVSENGWWYYFPIAIAVKTPLPFLGFLLTGFYAIARRGAVLRRDAQVLMPLLISLGVLGVAMTSNINIGLRYVLPVYPFFAIIAGYGAYFLWFSLPYNPTGRFLTIGLVGWYLVTTFAAHPDYLPYFNELAGDHPEDILVDSDLDWGQDIQRLSEALKDKNIETLRSCLFSSHRNRDLDAFGFPPMKKLPTDRETTGWIAISMMCLKMGTFEWPYDQFSWLEPHKPVERIGKSIDLYFIPKGD